MKKIYELLKTGFLTKIRYQAVLFLSTVIAIPILMLQLANIHFTSEMTREKNQAILNENLLLSKELLNNRLLTYRDIFFSISTDVDFIKNAESLNQTTTDTMIYRRIRDSLDTCITSNILLYPEIQAVGFIGSNHEPYIYSQKRQQFTSVVNYFNEHYLDLEITDNYSIRAGTVPVNSVAQKTESSFYISSNCINYEKMSPMGTLIIFINPEKLNEIINNTTSEIYQYTCRVLLSEDQSILCDKSGNTGYQWKDIEEYSSIHPESLSDSTEFFDKQILIACFPTDYFNLKLVNIVDYSKMNHSLVIFWPTITGISILILVFSLLFTYHLIGKVFITPIERIAKAMKSVDSTHLDNTFKTIRKDELGEIERSYNEMLAQIRSLLEKNQQQTEYLLEMNNRACNAELKSLELQINPHFIFNTLDTINWIAVQEGSTLVSEQIHRFASILRYTVYNINQIVPLSVETDWIHQYLKLQQIRFHNSFTYHISVDSDALKLKIHKLLLQPFLENSLIHGFDGITWKGSLLVHCHIVKKHWLRIQIIDNGTGIAPDLIQKIRMLFTPEHNMSQDFSSSIGLSNIVYRTRKYYPHSKLMVSSGHGTTCFKLWIPLKEMER